MSRRNTISREFFSTIAVVLVLGLSVMCAIQTALSAAYFVQERCTALNDILNGASKLCETFAEDGSVLTRPLDNEQARENARNGFDLFTTSSGAVLFVTDENGDILLHTGSEDFTEQPIPADMLAEMDAGDNIFKTGTLGGVYSGKYYTAGRRVEVGGYTGYLFAASPMTALASYMGDMLAMFGISAAVILLLCSLLCWVLAKRITGPIEDISEAARRLGSGDFTARAPVDGCVELADFATTFNNMAARLQTIDNSRGQFMGNIAHELRTPMTTIKGFIDGMLDGTIPPDGKTSVTWQHRLRGDRPPGPPGAEHAGHHQAGSRRGAHPRKKLRPVADRDRCGRSRTSSASRMARSTSRVLAGPTADDLRRPGFCASGRVQHRRQRHQVHPGRRRYQLCRRKARQHGGGPHREYRRRASPPKPCLLCLSASTKRTVPAA